MARPGVCRHGRGLDHARLERLQRQRRNRRLRSGHDALGRRTESHNGWLDFGWRWHDFDCVVSNRLVDPSCRGRQERRQCRGSEPDGQLYDHRRWRDHRESDRRDRCNRHCDRHIGYWRRPDQQFESDDRGCGHHWRAHGQEECSGGRQHRHRDRPGRGGAQYRGTICCHRA